MSFRGSECESRNLPKLLVLSCVGPSSNVVDSSTPLRCGRNDIPERWFCLPTQVVFATSPGTARRPFPTVSLVGGFFHPHRLYLSRCLAMNYRRYIAWFHLTATFRIQPVGLNGTTPRYVIPRERMRVEESSQVADFILWWFLYQRGGFLHSADAAVGMTYLGGGFVYPRRLYLQRFPERHAGRSLRFR